MNSLELGASLYVPATRSDLIEIACHRKIGNLRSVIFCLEDAVRSDEFELALRNLAHLCEVLDESSMLRFVRVRNPSVLRLLLDLPGSRRLTGFVLPKLTLESFNEYQRVIPPDFSQYLMPTLETADVFDAESMKRLRDELLRAWRERILCLRIGGNDLLRCLGLRRPSGRTIYETPLGPTITQLITIFRPFGLHLTAPVFDRMDCQATLDREVQTDVEFGLIGKTAIHPTQISLIESHYQVAPDDLAAALEILRAEAPAVFKLADTMCEPATHRAWAEMILARAAVFGESRRT